MIFIIFDTLFFINFDWYHGEERNRGMIYLISTVFNIKRIVQK